MKQYYLAVDIGASSGRHILGSYENGKISLEEIHRFENGMSKKDGHLCWDHEHLLREILAGMKKCREIGKIPVSMGIDTWGVDFVLVDKNGNMLGQSVGYRDHRTDTILKKMDAVISQKELYEKTGIQFHTFNTLNQLVALKDECPDQLKQAKVMLMTPDYFNFLLTGNQMQEYTIASTAQMLDLQTGEWCRDILERVGISADLMLTPQQPGTLVGSLKEELAKEVGFTCSVLMVASHDTAAAVMAVPSSTEESLYISSGTWSLMGSVCNDGINSTEAMDAGFTNEGGYGKKYRFLKNIMGLWMIQSVRNEFGKEYSFGQICDLAAKEEIASIVDCNDERFLSPASMVQEVKNACRESCQEIPETLGEIACVIYNSLARCYAEAKVQIEALTNRKYDTIHIIGGGSQATYLNELTAKYSSCKVIAGPSEATAVGNLLCQMIAFGVFSSLQDAKKCVIESFEVKTFE